MSQENGFQKSMSDIPFFDDTEWTGDDPCEGLTELECMYGKKAVDVTMIMAILGCTQEDMSDVLDELFEILDGIRQEIKYTCMNGNKIEIKINSDGDLLIDTDPKIEELEIE